MKKTWAYCCFPVLAAGMVLVLFSLCGIPKNTSATTGDLSPPQGCINGECHTSMGKGKFVHGPVAAGDCTFCHIPESKHKLKPIADVGKVCQECHGALFAIGSGHSKEDKSCSCHDPHQSSNRYLLITPGVNEKR